MNQQKFDHVIAVVKLRCGTAKANPGCTKRWHWRWTPRGGRRRRSRRAVMSAVDFVDNPTDLMYVGAYLSQVGLPQRALQIYRQAAALDPIHPSPTCSACERPAQPTISTD